MNVLMYHHQVKKEKNAPLENVASMTLYEYNNLIHFISEFKFHYKIFGGKKMISIWHGFTINLKNGDFQVSYQLVNENPETAKLLKSKNNRTNNKFDALLNLTELGFYKGERRHNYWGVRYKRACDKIMDIISDKIIPLVEGDFYQNKNYQDKPVLNSFYDLIVDFHLDKKKIKAHDSIYFSIRNDYPKTKWLKQNDYKFLPAVLDMYGIKSKYLIGEINKESTKEINIRTLSYICKLFGEGYVDYLKQFNWKYHSQFSMPNKRYHTLLNDTEKRFMVSLFKNWEKDDLKSDSIVSGINELLSMREYLNGKFDDLKFKAKDDHTFEMLYKKWEGFKNHIKKGYRLRVVLNDDFVRKVEEDICVDEKLFNVRILKTEQDFVIEGYNMKNCMGKQFNTAQFYIYISMSHKGKTINLQYRRGALSQSYGKANTPVDKMFNNSIEKLNKKMSEHPNIEIKKEKFDFI